MKFKKFSTNKIDYIIRNVSNINMTLYKNKDVKNKRKAPCYMTLSLPTV